MNYGRIRRGPMAGDAFTQIRNVLFRDPRLSFRDKGIFGLISTHRDGFGVTAESIAACSSTDGVSGVKTSLRALEKYGYLKRTRERRPDGTLGGAVYFITDQPELFEESEAENSRSQPTVPQPTQVQPTVVQPALAGPTVVESPHKKTIPLVKKISSEKTPSSSPSDPIAPGAPDVTEGGGGDSDLRSIAEHITAHLDYRGTIPDRRQRQTICDRLSAALDAGWTVDGLAVYLDLGDAPVRSAAAVYAARLHPDRIPAPEAPPAPQGRRGGPRGDLPTAAEIEADGGVWGQAAARARQRLDARAPVGAAAGHRSHTPYRNDPWFTPADPLAAAKVPHCGDLDCDPVTRLRAQGADKPQVCPDCHPNMQGFGP